MKKMLVTVTLAVLASGTLGDMKQIDLFHAKEEQMQKCLCQLFGRFFLPNLGDMKQIGPMQFVSCYAR